MTLFIIVCDSKRFLNFFLFNKATAPADHSVVFKKRPWRITRIVAKTLFIIWAIGLMGYDKMITAQYYSNYSVKPPLYGIYNVQTFVYNNDTLPPIVADNSIRWRKLEILSVGNAKLYKMNDSMSRQICTIDTNDRSVVLAPVKGDQVFNVNYTKEGDDILIFSGRVSNSTGFIRKYDSVYIKMRKSGEEDFLLMKRGFHWINEHPLNR